MFSKSLALPTTSDKKDYYELSSIPLNRSFQSKVSNSVREPLLSRTRLGSFSLSCAKQRNKAYLFPNQNKSLNVQFDTNTKEVKGLFGFAEGKEVTSSSCECQLQMINESTETNRKASKSTQGQVVQMSKGRANRQFLVMFMEDFPSKGHKVLWLKRWGMETLPQTYRKEMSANPLDTHKSISPHMLADLVRGGEAVSWECLLSTLVYRSRWTDLI